MASDYSTLAQILGSQGLAKSVLSPAASGWGLRNGPKSQEEWDKYTAGWDPNLQFLAKAPVATKKTGGGNVDNLINELTALVPKGYKIDTKSGNTAKQIQRLAPDLARFGVQSLSDLKAYQVPAPNGKGTKSVFYNQRTGTVLPENFGSSMKGKGGSNYSLVAVGDRVLPVASWRDTSEAADLAPALMVLTAGAGLALAPAAAAIGSSIANATGMSAAAGQALATAGASGLLQGTTSALAGGDFGKGFLTGAVGSGIGSAVGAYNPGGMITSNAAIGSTINKALASGLSGAAGAAINKGDVAGGAVRGFVQGAVSGLAGSYVGNQVGGAIGNLVAKALGTTSGGGQAPAPAGGTQQATAAPAPVASTESTGFGTGSSLLSSSNPAMGYGTPNQLRAQRGIFRRAA